MTDDTGSDTHAVVGVSLLAHRVIHGEIKLGFNIAQDMTCLRIPQVYLVYTEYIPGTWYHIPKYLVCVQHLPCVKS